MGKFLLACSIVIAVAVTPGSAWAEDESANDAAESQRTPSATTPDAIADQARARVRRGLELYDAGEYRLALSEFERAHAIVPSFKILFNIGQVHYQLGQYARAHAALRRYLDEGGSEVPPSRRAEVETDLAELTRRVAAVTVETSPPGAEVSFDEMPIGLAPTRRIFVDAGALRVRASKVGYAAQTRVVSLAGGDEVALQLELAKLPVDSPPPSSDGLPALTVGAWIVTGALAAGAIGTGIGASAAASRFETMRDAPIQGSAAQAKADLDRQGDLADALAITTDVLIVSSIVAGGVSLWLTLRGRSKPGSASTRSCPGSLDWSF